jgi:sRNA-binding regulator protein Hfq
MPGPPRHRGGGRRRPPERRKPPEESTGEERKFLNQQLKSGDRLRVEMIDGSQSEGTVSSFNEGTIELDTEEQAGVMLHKSQIRSIEETD